MPKNLIFTAKWNLKYSNKFCWLWQSFIDNHRVFIKLLQKFIEGDALYKLMMTWEKMKIGKYTQEDLKIN